MTTFLWCLLATSAIMEVSGLPTAFLPSEPYRSSRSPLQSSLSTQSDLYAREGHAKYSQVSRRSSRSRRQILPPASTHPLTFVPGTFTRDGATAACGPGMQLAAIDAYNWGSATTMTEGVGAWIQSWNTDNYGGTCIALYSSNSINVPPQGCNQLLAALCEPSTAAPPPPVSPPPPPAPTPDDSADAPADDPAPDDPAPDDDSGDDS